MVKLDLFESNMYLHRLMIGPGEAQVSCAASGRLQIRRKQEKVDYCCTGFAFGVCYIYASVRWLCIIIDPVPSRWEKIRFNSLIINRIKYLTRKMGFEEGWTLVPVPCNHYVISLIIFGQQELFQISHLLIADAPVIIGFVVRVDHQELLSVRHRISHDQETPVEHEQPLWPGILTGKGKTADFHGI